MYVCLLTFCNRFFLYSFLYSFLAPLTLGPLGLIIVLMAFPEKVRTLVRTVSDKCVSVPKFYCPMGYMWHKHSRGWEIS